MVRKWCAKKEAAGSPWKGSGKAVGRQYGGGVGVEIRQW